MDGCVRGAEEDVTSSCASVPAFYKLALPLRDFISIVKCISYQPFTGEPTVLFIILSQRQGLAAELICDLFNSYSTKT